MKKGVLKGAVLIALAFMLTVSTGFADNGVIKKGESSKEIAAIQADLKKLGFFHETCTGYFGDATEKAVIAFQKKYDLGADGVIGSTTLSWIKKLAPNGKSSSIVPSRSMNTPRTQVNITYTVKKGDTIWDIADDFNISVEAIMRENGLTENSVLQIDQKLIIPGVVKIVKNTTPNPVAVVPPVAADPKTEQPPVAPTPAETNANPDEVNTDNIYFVKESDTLSSIAEDFGVSVEALAAENNLTVDAVLQVGQELKIPEVVTIDNNNADPTDKTIKGEYLNWFGTVDQIFEKGDIATVTDVETGKTFQVKRLYGRNHADSEPLTADDTAIMKALYNGSWSWDRRAIVVTIKGKNIAASMNGMPHGGQSIKNNDFGGHFCIHFKGSKTHKGNRSDPRHAAAVKKAAGL